jgi:hypothetical protein
MDGRDEDEYLRLNVRSNHLAWTTPIRYLVSPYIFEDQAVGTHHSAKASRMTGPLESTMYFWYSSLLK